MRTPPLSVVALTRSAALAMIPTLLGLAGLVVGSRSPEPHSAAVVDTILVEIGVIHGDPRQLFGNIRDLEVDRNGNMLILDDQSYTLSWFSPNGDFRGSAGGKGGGPAEFRSPSGLAVSDEDSVYVLDAGRQRVVVFEMTKAGLRFARGFGIPVHGVDACVLDDHIVVLGETSGDGPGGYILHEVSLDGEPIRSFGDPVSVEMTPELSRSADLIASLNRRGVLFCGNGDEVWVGSERLGVVQSYSTSGVQRWNTELIGFSPARWEVLGNGGMRMGIDPNTGFASTLKALADGGAGRIAVSVHEGSIESSGLSVALIDALSGVQVARSESDMIVTARRDNLLYGFVNDPFPQVRVVRARLPD